MSYTELTVAQDMATPGFGRRIVSAAETTRTGRLAAVILCLASFPIMAGQALTQSRAEQLHYSAGQSMENSIVLPDEALAVIEKDPYIAEVLKNEAPAFARLPRSWLMASEVHLDGPDEIDIVVVGAGHLAGANVTTFWILRPKNQGFVTL